MEGSPTSSLDSFPSTPCFPILLESPYEILLRLLADHEMPDGVKKKSGSINFEDYEVMLQKYSIVFLPV